MEVPAVLRTECAPSARERHLLKATALAVSIIMDTREGYTTFRKEGTGDTGVEFVTDRDMKAQAAIVDYLRPKYPDHRYLAEEDGVKFPWRGKGPRVVIDPLDGTDHYTARNYAAACTMTAIVDGAGKGVAACIRNLDGSAYSWDACSPDVRFWFEGAWRPVITPTARNGTIFLRRPLAWYASGTRRLVEAAEVSKVSELSLGVMLQRLWAGECRACVLWSGSKHTPWDMTAINIISHQLGYVFLRSTPDGKAFTTVPLELPTEAVPVRGYDLAIIHKNDLGLVEHLLRY